jgi:hypothetical protein
MSLTIPQTLLKTLQATFDSEARKLAKDAAKILKVPEKEVLEIIKKTPKVQLQVLDDTEMVNTCPIYIQSEKVMARCRNPCIIGTGKCLEHQKTPIKNVDETKFIKLTRIKVLDTTISEPEPLWCNEEDKLIYNSMGQKVGILNEDNNIEYFVIKE